MCGIIYDVPCRTLEFKIGERNISFYLVREGHHIDTYLLKAERH